VSGAKIRAEKSAMLGNIIGGGASQSSEGLPGKANQRSMSVHPDQSRGLARGVPEFFPIGIFGQENFRWVVASARLVQNAGSLMLTPLAVPAVTQIR
jgi:hypothetical protein